ncbi:hypothetical protein PG985_001318 [Apiospora marii]|uniref:Uncharacterized protein n=1 Tax=Apiospora marii TaxID=335849 RepID=A0ABR1RI04_9PEZI
MLREPPAAQRFIRGRAQARVRPGLHHRDDVRTNHGRPEPILHPRGETHQPGSSAARLPAQRQKEEQHGAEGEGGNDRRDDNVASRLVRYVPENAAGLSNHSDLNGLTYDTSTQE